MRTEDIYKDLTGVNITEQKILGDERGKGYYGEYLVFKEIYSYISGCCKILMNLQIPTSTGGTTELDLVLVHETGLYVFEVKHYKGTIYGKISEQRWTQYFRTAPNNSFYNPVNQNQHHIQALKCMYPNLPIYSFIVFTNDQCELRIEGREENIDIGRLSGLKIRLERKIANNKEILTRERMDAIFCELLSYAPHSKHEVRYNRELVSFYKFIELIRNDADILKKREKSKKVIFGIVAGIICLFVIINSSNICSDYKKNCDKISDTYKEEYEKLAQKFQQVDELNNGNLIVREDMLTVTELKLEDSADILNAVECNFLVKGNSEDYGIQIPEEAKIIVILKDGQVQEYEFWGERHKYNDSRSRIGYTAEPVKILPHEFYDIKAEDISYIKLTGLTLWRWENKTWGIREDVLMDMEFEVYDAGVN